VKMDGAKERTVTFDAAQMRHFDHGYAVTSHSSQGLTADRVLVNMDTKVHPELINTRFAYVSVSRASEDVRIYTNDAAVLSERLSTDVTKTSAVDLQKAQVEPTHNQQTQTKEPPMTNSREHSQEELRRQILAETIFTHPKTSAPLPTSSTGTMLQSKQPCQRKRQTTSGSARPARSRATSTPMREAGCTSTRKASSTTARRSRSREKPLLSKPANPRLTQWATTPKCSPAAKTPPTSA
jgi:hypothetical protein